MTALTGTIGPAARERHIDRAGELLRDAFEAMSGAAAPQPTAPLLRDGGFLDQARWKEAVTFALLRSPLPPGAVSLLQRAAACEVRIYAAGDADALRALSSALPRDAQLLGRTVAAPGTAVVGTDTGEGVLWLGPAGQVPPWMLPLEEAQGRMLLRAGLHLFWREATAEWWREGGRLTEHPPMDHSVPTDPSGHGDAVRVAPFQELPPVTGATICYAPDDRPLGPAPEVLVNPATGSAPGVAADGCRVSWTDLGLPAATVGPQGAEIELRATGGLALRLRLSPAQSRALERLLRSVADRPELVFHREVTLGGLRGSVLLPGSRHLAPVEDDVVVQAEDVPCATLDDVPTAEPATPALAATVRTVVKRWRNLPPTAPADARPDPLVGRWRALDERIDARRSRLREALRAQRDKAARLCRDHGERAATARQAQVALERLIDGEGGLEQVPSSLGPQGARQVLSRLQELDHGLDGIRAELRSLQSRIEAELEDERQRRAWESRRREAERARAEADARLPEQRERLARAEAALRDVEAQATEDTRPQRKDNRGRNQPPGAAKEHKERRALVEQARADLTRLERQRRDAEETLGRPFAPKPRLPEPPLEAAPTPPTPFVPAAPAPVEDVPGEPLPSVGQLLNAGSTRLLAIRTWEELEQGRAEAHRLGALLVAAAP